MFGVTMIMVTGIPPITPAFPRIVEKLQLATTDVGMLIVAFMLPGVVLSPFAGILGDRFGRKRILVPCLFLFGLAGGACALSQTFSILITLRLLQGIGGAGLSSLSLTILGDLFSGERRAEAMGLNVSVLHIGTASYPLIGGTLATLAWNYPFLLATAALPIGILVMLFLHNPEPRSSTNLREYLTGTWSYLKNIRAIAAFTAGIIGFAIHFGTKLTYFSLYLGNIFYASPFVIGAITSSMSLTMALVAAQMGRLVRITSVTNLVKLGFVICAIALALIPFMPRLALLLVPTIIYGFGRAIISPCLRIYVSELTPAEHRAAFMPINSTMFRLGQTVGPIIIGLGYVYGNFKGAFLLAAGISLATAIVGFIGGKIIR